MARMEYGSEVSTSGWAISGVWFAASMMLLIGTFQLLAGIAAIVNDQYFVVTRHYAFNVDVTAWGWFNLFFGIILIIAGFALFSGRTWAAILALILAGLTALNNFLFIPHQPWWSLTMIALSAWVIWSLTRPGAVVEI